MARHCKNVATFAPHSGTKVPAPPAGSPAWQVSGACDPIRGGRIRPDERVTEDEVRQSLSAKVGHAPTQVPGNLTHGDFFLLAAPLL